ncbi:MAG: hypothetical protein JRF08_03410 [Deltaproteobacteria bacterium]|nr:hypothetical protein [Deltaproteobacteria bacterium]
MEGSQDTYKREYRKVTIRTIDGTTILGKVNIGIKDRVSEVFTKTDNPFIVLFDVEHKDISGKVQKISD